MIAFAVLLNSRTSGLKTVVKRDWNGMTTLAVRSGSASAKFLGTSSPSTIEKIVAIATPTMVPTTGRQPPAPRGRAADRPTAS